MVKAEFIHFRRSFLFLATKRKFYFFRVSDFWLMKIRGGGMKFEEWTLNCCQIHARFVVLYPIKYFGIFSYSMSTSGYPRPPRKGEQWIASKRGTVTTILY